MNKYIKNPPEIYFILTSNSKINNQWHKIEPMITSDYVYFIDGAVAVYSSFDIANNQDHGNPLELICLVCFYHIMRKAMKLRSSVIDDQFYVQIKPWRAPCESTAIFTNKDGGIYFLEGCRDTGVFWRPAKNSPRTVPPFVSCGALDTNGGCWGEDCSFGYYFEDEEEPFS
jgi:hypothetical protein